MDSAKVRASWFHKQGLDGGYDRHRCRNGISNEFYIILLCGSEAILAGLQNACIKFVIDQTSDKIWRNPRHREAF
jgi:hypothetical protein